MKSSVFSSVLLGLALAGLSVPVIADSTLSEKAQAEKRSQQQHNKAREARFKMTEAELQRLKAELISQRTSLQKQNDKLAARFSDNEEKLARLEEKLRLETGSLGEVFGVVRQNAKQLQSELKTSVTSAGAQSYNKEIDDIVAATTLPSMPQLEGMWKALEQQIRASGQIGKTQVNYINGEGEREIADALRLGAFALVSDKGYLDWNGNKQEARAFTRQPEQGATLQNLQPLLSGETYTSIIDPSRGVMLEQLALTPSLMDRFQAGGVVGKIIAGLLAIGMLIALIRGISLSVTRQKIGNQLKKPQQPGNNPLGRILAVYEPDKNRTVEALELRLLESIVDEQASLERGLSMLKLLAGLAPMLGLLGTVTGMIETFQVITQFGNSDPKVMAGGISMALVTTVLGLIAAMPLLLAHNILSSQAETICNILEKQGIAMVAEQAEKVPSSEQPAASVA